MGRWIRLFTEGDATQRDLLGGKGANLAEMTRLGLPIPPGFTVTTEACLEYLRHDGRIPEGLWEEVEYGIRYIEGRMGRRFGDAGKPLLLSVRSGAAASMPGMMDTILNIGLNDETATGLGTLMGERFALDAHRRLIQMFGKVVLGAPSDKFDDALSGARLALGVKSDHELTPVALRRLIDHFREILQAQDAALPDDPREQVREAILAVFRSFNTERAISYRQMHGLSESMGTAANVQAMVFGNMGSDSATGVAFTRDPNTGAPGLFGEFPLLTPTWTTDPAERTELNVRDSDATLIVAPCNLHSPGTELTATLALRHGKPCRVTHGSDPSEVARWLEAIGPGVRLNVAGPRASEWAEGYETCRALLNAVLTPT